MIRRLWRAWARRKIASDPFWRHPKIRRALAHPERMHDATRRATEPTAINWQAMRSRAR